MFDRTCISINQHQRLFITSLCSGPTANVLTSTMVREKCEYSYYFSERHKRPWSCSFDGPPFSRIKCRGERNFVTISAEDLLILVRDSYGEHHLLQDRLATDANVRKRIMDLVANGDGSLLLQLSNSANGSMIIQTLIDFSDYHPDMKKSLFSRIETLAFDMAYNMFACSIFVAKLPEHHLHAMLNSKQFRDNATLLVTDQNGSYLVRNIIESAHPKAYMHFFTALSESSPEGLKTVMENKYGCRVIQFALEHIVKICARARNENEVHLDILHLIMVPILKEAGQLAGNEYANYVVQCVLKLDYLHRQRRHIVRNHLMHNILALSQSKYSSHVVEQALVHADDQCLAAMFVEVLDGYETSADGTTALDCMMHNQFGNYVVQKMLSIAIEVCMGKRRGDLRWFERIAAAFSKNRESLLRYSSGKEMLGATRRTLVATGIAVPPRLLDVLPQHRHQVQQKRAIRRSNASFLDPSLTVKSADSSSSECAPKLYIDAKLTEYYHF